MMRLSYQIGQKLLIRLNTYLTITKFVKFKKSYMYKVPDDEPC